VHSALDGSKTAYGDVQAQLKNISYVVSPCIDSLGDGAKLLIRVGQAIPEEALADMLRSYPNLPNHDRLEVQRRHARGWRKLQSEIVLVDDACDIGDVRS